MSLPTLDTDLNIIAGLDNLPNDVTGLTPAQLKAKYDLAGTTIQTFINATLKPAIETLVTQSLPIPDGGLGDVKLSNDPSDIKQRFSAHLEDILPNIKSIGAYNDDSHPTETTAAFQQAINNSKYYYVPSGTYTLNAPLTGDRIFLVSDGQVTIYVDHNGDFLDLTGSPSQAPLLINISILKRNTFVNTGKGIYQTGGTSSSDIGNQLTMRNVVIKYFDTGMSLQGMNWGKFDKVTISQCTTGLVLDGTTNPYASNNGNDFDITITQCTTGLKLLGDALSNNFSKADIGGNTLGCLADETGYSVQGLVGNTFTHLWCEGNTNDFTLKNGRLWRFVDLGHTSGTFFTSDTAFESCMMESSNTNDICSIPLKGLTVINKVNNYPSVLDAHAMTDLSIKSVKNQSLLNLPNVKSVHVAGQVLVNTAYQSGPAKQNLIGWNVPAISSNAIHDIFDGSWTSPSSGGALTSGQADPWGGTKAYKYVGTGSNFYGHFNLLATSDQRTFTFQVLAKAVDPTENSKLSLFVESASQVPRNDFILNKEGWQLYFITMRFTGGTTWLNCRIGVTSTSGILLVRPCLYESDSPGLAQRGNVDGLTVGESLIIENGRYIVYRSVVPSSGTWINGDRVRITPPTTGGYAEQICTSDGAPGTWKGLNQISATKNTTANRPTGISVGYLYLDTTLDPDGKPIWYTGTAWVDATGAVV